jgi:outer membrane receptor protein involved in Fe transport
VILKQDYNGVSVSATYGSTTRGDGSISQLQVAGGTSFERTSFIFTGSIEELGAVELGKRDFLQTAREQLLRNNPAALPVGGVIGPYGLTPNFRSANGSPLYGPNTPNFGSVPSGYLGNGVQGLLPGAGTYSLGIHNSANVLGGGRYQIEPETRKRGLMSSVTHELSGDIRLFGEVIASQNTVTNFGGPSPFFTLPPGVPGNPFPTLVFVTVPTSSIDTKSITENTMWSGVFGGTFRLWRDWTGNLEAGISRYTIKLTSAPTSFLPSLNSAIASGSINVFRDTTLNTIDLSAYLAPRPELTPFTQTTRNASLRLGGPVLSMPAGPLVLTSLVETQREKSDDGLLKTSTSQTLFPGVSQTTESAYVEATIPLVGNRFRAPGEAALEAQVAGRYDRFETDTAPSGPVTTPVIRTKASDSSVNPTVSIRYQPMQGLAMRASYARGFLPPAAGQLVQMATTTPTTLADPRRGGETVALPAGTVLTGGNPSLGPERSSSSSIGVILTPPAVPQLRLSIDYTKIDKTDNIEALGSARLLANEDLFPGRISRTSPQANDPFGVGRIVALDVSNVNVSSAKISAVDLKASYSHNLGSGFVDLDGLMTWQRQYDTQLVPAAPVIDRVSLSGQNNPLRFRGNIAVQWRTQAYRVKLDTRYRDSYRLDTSLASNGPFFNYALSNGGQRVASRTYNDLFAAARLPKEFPLGEAELSLYVTNLFDIKPRFDPSEGTAYLVSPYDDLRLRSIRVSIRMTF